MPTDARCGEPVAGAPSVMNHLERHDESVGRLSGQRSGRTTDDRRGTTVPCPFSCRIDADHRANRGVAAIRNRDNDDYRFTAGPTHNPRLPSRRDATSLCLVAHKRNRKTAPRAQNSSNFLKQPFFSASFDNSIGGCLVDRCA
jgi:hypothetical protein